MECPGCGSNKTKVYDTKKCRGAVFRRRLCEQCGFKFESTEVVDDEKNRNNNKEEEYGT